MVCPFLCNFCFTTVIKRKLSSLFGGLMAISTKEELQFLLHRGWEIEKKFEYLSAWKGFVTVALTYRMTLLTLARDSHKHKLNLEKLLKILNLEAPTNEIPDETFDFAGMFDAEILQKIIEQDEIVADLYTELEEKTDPKLIATLANEKGVEFFYQMLKQMVEDEKRHVKMVRAYVLTIERIQ